MSVKIMGIFLYSKRCCTPQPGGIRLDNISYITGEIVPRSGEFQNRQCKLSKGTREITRERFSRKYKKTVA